MIQALVGVMLLHRSGNTPSPKTTTSHSVRDIYVARLQWVKHIYIFICVFIYGKYNHIHEHFSLTSADGDTVPWANNKFETLHIVIYNICMCVCMAEIRISSIWLQDTMGYSIGWQHYPEYANVNVTCQIPEVMRCVSSRDRQMLINTYKTLSILPKHRWDCMLSRITNAKQIVFKMLQFRKSHIDYYISMA